MARPELKSHPDKNHQQDREWTSAPNIDSCSTTEVSLSSSSEAEDGNVMSKTLLLMWVKQCWGCAVEHPLLPLWSRGENYGGPKGAENEMRARPLRLILKSQSQKLLFSASTKKIWENRVVAATGTKSHPGTRHKNQTGWVCPKPYRPWVPQTKRCLWHWLTWVQGQCHGNCLQCQGRFI